VKWILFFGILGILIFVSFQLRSNKKKPQLSLSPAVSSVKPSEEFQDQSRILFVPYWTLEEKVVSDTFDRLIYFGISANTEGIDTKEDGYKKITKFYKLADTRRDKYLTLRMIDSKANFAILENKDAQKNVINQTITLAKEKEFTGVVLDLEVIGLPFNSVINQINEFVKQFYTKSKENKLEFSIMLFGDVFYRVRPYDVKKIAQYGDKIFVMSYDFHKAGGAPGPNFPFSGKEKYGYDFKTMTDNFSKIVGIEKLVIVFGLFGYDWTVDENNHAIKPGVALSLNNAKKKFLQNCEFKNCSVKRDSISSETEVHYKDAQEKNHIVWFEDEESVLKKKEYLKEKGITKTAFWAYSYF